MNNEDNLLKYGDCIILTTKQGFIQTQGFITKPSCFIQVGFRECQIYQRNMRDFVFQVMPRMQYDAFKEFTNFKIYYDRLVQQAKHGTGITQQDKLRMAQLQKKLIEEVETNKKIFERRKGEVVQYGNELQLLHYDSQSFLEGTKNCADIDKSCNMIKLNPQGSKFVCFIVEPRYKYRNQGQSVNYCDVVIFRNMKTSQFLHISDREILLPTPRSKDKIKEKNKNYRPVVPEKIDRRMLSEEFAALHEVNTSTSRNKFTIRLFRGWQDDGSKNILNGSMIVRLQHSESGGFLCSDDIDFTGDGLAEVFLWNYKGKSTDIEATSTQAYFELEIVGDVYGANGANCTYSGNISNEQSKLDGGMIFRLRHLNSGRLVVMQALEKGKHRPTEVMSVGLSDHLEAEFPPILRPNKSTVTVKCTNEDQMKHIEENSKFRLVSTGVDIDNRIRADTSVQIQHYASKRFLYHETKIKFDFQQEEIQDGSASESGNPSVGKIIMIAGEPEKLDFSCYKQMDDALLSQGNRELLAFAEASSYENAFFIKPEPNIKDVLFIHTSVNVINSFLIEICDTMYGHSRERQKRVEDVIRHLIVFLDEKEIIADDEEQASQLDAPFGGDSDDMQSVIQNKKLLKQKICRELRVIEACVDILHAPFACGSFNFRELNPELAILSLCKLSYTLLSHIVDQYPLNELFASQWMNLYLGHVLQTSTDNQIGADAFVTQLVNSNKIILKEQISSELIENFIMKSQRSSETERLLRLLTALCSCQGESQKSNQDDIIRVLMSREEARLKFLMPIRKLKRKDLEICLDLRAEQWAPILSESKRFTNLQMQLQNSFDEDVEHRFKIKPADALFVYNYNAFHELLNLLADCCLGRNVRSQEEVGKYYENKHLITIYQDKKFNYQTRSRCLKLFLNLYLDRDPFQPLLLPSETVIWRDMPQLEFRGEQLTKAITAGEVDFEIKQSKVRIPTTLKEQKVFCTNYLKQTKGIIDLKEDSTNQMNIEVLRTVLFMLNHGFYEQQDELKKLAAPLILLLNGSTDNYNQPEIIQQPGEEIKPNVMRYFPTKSSAIILKQKSLCCDILLRILALETDAKALLFIQKLKQDIEYVGTVASHGKINKGRKGTKKVEPIEELPRGPVPEQEDLDLIEAISLTKGFESVNESEYICILFDLMLYRSAELTKRVFSLLVSYFTRKRTLIEAMETMKILETAKSIHTMSRIKKLNIDLQKLKKEMMFWIMKNSGTGLEQKEFCTSIFIQFESFCVIKKKELDEEEDDEQPGMQSSMNLDVTGKNTNKSVKPAKVVEEKEKDAYILFDVEINNTKPHKENQRLLQSFDVVSVALMIIKQRVDRITNYNSAYITLITSCYRFLVAFVRDNTENQTKVYDDLDVFMRDIDKYSVAALLVKEIFKNNKKFLTLNVAKFIRQIVNTSEEVALVSFKKSMYLKLLEVYCRFEDKLIRQNQNDIILQMTADTTRSNVLYLFQAEGAKELGNHIKACLEIKNDYSYAGEDSPSAVHEKDQLVSALPHITNQDEELGSSMKKTNLSSQKKEKKQKGLQKMIKPIFNVIQLLQLVTLCCEGKSEIAEKRANVYVLSFRVSANIIQMAEDFWPLKIAIYKYISHVFIDSSDPNFMKQPGTGGGGDEEGDSGGEEGSAQASDETDISILLKLVENLNTDFESYINGELKCTRLEMPDGQFLNMDELGEDYIFNTGLTFIHSTLKRKTYDVGSVELKFYVIAKNVAQLFYVATRRESKLACYDLLHYIYTSDRHGKYLDNVKHPAKKAKQSREMMELLAEPEPDPGEVTSVSQTSAIGANDPAMSKSTKLTNRIQLIINKEEIKIMKQREFEELVSWMTNISDKISLTMSGKKGGDPNSFQSLNYRSIMTSFLGLMDARVLSKNLQIAGLILLRKIIEVENKEMFTPAADWDTSEWVHYRRIIKIKQDSLVERGVIQFICKQIQSQEDPEIQEECLLVCIAIILGGNQNSQENFFQYMRQDETENKLMLTFKSMLIRNFDLTKKYLNEKNAKIEMVYKVKERFKEQKLREEQLKNEQQHKLASPHGAEGDTVPEEHEKMLSISLSDNEEDGAEGENQEAPKPKKAVQEDSKEKSLITTIRILRFLQLLCEGHQPYLQNHLREQTNEAGAKSGRSFDFVAYISNMFNIYVKSFVNCYSTILGNQIIECLIELIQGPCRQNQRTLVDTKAIDCCRDLLSQGMGNPQELELKGFVGKRENLLDDLKMSSVKMLLSILEGPVDEDISSRVSSSLGDFEIVTQRMQNVYEMFVTDVLKLPKDADPKKIQNSLQKDSFDSCIQEGFDIFSLLNQLAEVLPEDREKLERFKEFSYYQFFQKNNGVIEITTPFDILRIFFPLQPICSFLTPNTMKKFLLNVERESNQHKLMGLCGQVPSFIEEMEHLEIMSHQTIQITPSRLNSLRDQSTLIAVMVGGVILTQYKYAAVIQPDGSYNYMPSIDNIPNNIIFGLGCIQLITALLLLIGFCVNKINLIVRAGWRQRVDRNQIKMLLEKKQLEIMRSSTFSELKVHELDIFTNRIILQVEGPFSTVFWDERTKKREFGSIALAFEYYWISLSFLISNGEFIFFVLYYCFSVQGLIQSPVFYSFHLLDVINRFPALQNVILSVTTNINQLLMTAMLGIILIYIWACIAFLFIADNYFDDAIHTGLLNKAGDSVCMSLMHCFLSTINYGLRFGGGMGDFFPTVTVESWAWQDKWIRFYFDLSFNLVVSVICLNVIFGIIIDTFAQLREASSNIEEDKKNICFICGLSRYILDRDTEEGFDAHQNEDHFIWNYLYFIIHLQIKDKTEFNGAESYIFKCIQNEDMVWFPQHKSIRLMQVMKKREQADMKIVIGEAAQEEKLDVQVERCNEILASLEAQLQ